MLVLRPAGDAAALRLQLRRVRGAPAEPGCERHAWRGRPPARSRRVAFLEESGMPSVQKISAPQPTCVESENANLETRRASQAVPLAVSRVTPRARIKTTQW